LQTQYPSLTPQRGCCCKFATQFYSRRCVHTVLYYSHYGLLLRSWGKSKSASFTFVRSAVCLHEQHCSKKVLRRRCPTRDEL